jgi:hypothetical protein
MSATRFTHTAIFTLEFSGGSVSGLKVNREGYYAADGPERVLDREEMQLKNFKLGAAPSC